MNVRVRIAASNGTDGTAGWGVDLLDGATGQPLLAPGTGAPLLAPDARVLQGAQDPVSLRWFPFPTAAELGAIAAGAIDDAPHARFRTFCDPQRVAFVASELRNVALRASTEVRAFARYLGALLLPDAAWKALLGAPRGEGAWLDVEIELGAGTQDLASLPWEALATGEGGSAEWKHLAEQSWTSLVRRVAGTGAVALPPVFEPRILCVVGSLVDDPRIRAGAEYLAVLRAIEHAGAPPGGVARVAPQLRLLLKATPRAVEDAVRDFRPTVVHMISHGQLTANGVAVELIDPTAPSKHVLCSGARLAELFRGPDGLPTVVVLSSCFTAGDLAKAGGLPSQQADANTNADVGQVSSPLAEELARAGVPIVVGMSGEVTDQACRLFARCFYEGLLRGYDVRHAAASARQQSLVPPAGMATLSDRATIDWASAAMFLAPGVDPGAVVQPTAAREWVRRVQPLVPAYYPALCDRVPVADALGALWSGNGATRVVLVKANKAESAEQRLGRTRALGLAYHAALRAGHVAVWVTEDHIEQVYPRMGNVDDDVAPLWGALEEALGVLYQWSGADVRAKMDYPRVCQLAGVAPTGHAAALASMRPATQAVMPGPGAAPKLSRAAEVLYADLVLAHGELVARVREWAANTTETTEKLALEGLASRMKLVLLIDDLDCTTDGAATAVRELMKLVVGFADSDIRIVVAAGEQRLSRVDTEVLTKWAPNAGSRLQVVRLERFSSAECQLAYTEFLLGWRENNRPDGEVRPLVFANAEARRKGLLGLQRYAQNVPGLLVNNDKLEVAVTTQRDLQVLVEATDEALVVEILG